MNTKEVNLLDKAITLQSKYCLSPEWKALFETTCPDTNKKVSLLVCGKKPTDTQKEVVVYVVNHPQYKGRIDVLSLGEYTQLAMLGECVYDRENGIARYSEFSPI